MNEEIDIIELLKRVKEGKAPKRIEIDGKKFILKDLENTPIEWLYYKEDDDGYFLNWVENVDIFFNTKIKILDKHIIEKIDITNKLITNHAEIIITKLNEVIDYINNKE